MVSSPTRVARALSQPDWLTVAAEIVSPTALSTGMDSPVSAASLTAELPSSTTPSTGTASPGRTMKTSSFCSSATGTLRSAPSRSTVAVWGASFMRLLSASVVRPLDLASSILPTVMSVRIIAADSK